MTQSRAERTRDAYNYGQYINQFPPNTIKVIREFERIQKNICRHKMSIMFNEMCVCMYVYIYIYIYIYNSEPVCCIGIMKSITAVIKILTQIQADYFVSDTNGFINFCLRSMITRGERQNFLKACTNHTPTHGASC